MDPLPAPPPARQAVERRELGFWLAAALSGERAAWNELCLRLERRVFVYAFRLLGDAERARDVTQETLARVVARAHTLAAHDLCVPWSLKIARHLVWKELARTRAYARDDDAPADEPGDIETPLDRALAREEIETLHAALHALAPAQRELIHFYYFEELPVDELAALLSAPAGTVKWRLFRAREALAREFTRRTR